MASYTPTNWVAHETLISADRMNNIEAGIAAFYPQTQIIAPEQTVTITSETDPETGVPITLAEGIDLSTFSQADLLGLSVSINGEAATFAAQTGWTIDVDGGKVVVFPAYDIVANKIIGLSLSAANPEPLAVLPGDYTVEIAGVITKFPTFKAFSVSGGLDTAVAWVINAPKEDVDAAMANGCVLLYANAPTTRNGFAFGCLVRNVMYYATLTDGSFEWNAGTVTLNDGKYVVLGTV